MISLEASPIMSTKQKESKKDQRQFWQMAIETWQSSGLSIRRFCKQEGLSEPSFYAWRKRLPQVDESDADKEAVCQSEPFIQVSLPTEKHGGLELVFSSGHTLRISSPADTQTLTTVLSALCEAGLCWRSHHRWRYSYTLSLPTCGVDLINFRCLRKVLCSRIHSADTCLSSSISTATSAKYCSGTEPDLSSGINGSKKAPLKD